MSSSAKRRIDFDETDEKRRKRMISNRESARRSRMKKQQQVNELIAEMSGLQSHNKAIISKIHEVGNMFDGIASENNILTTQILELNDKLNSLNSMLCYVEKDALVKPWQLPHPAPAATFSANMFNL